MRKGSNHLEFHPWTTKVWARPGMCPRANQGPVGRASHHNPFLPRVDLPGEALAASFLLDPVSPQAPDTTMLPTLWGRVGRAGKDHMGGAGVGSSRSWTKDRRDNETSILGVPVVRRDLLPGSIDLRTPPRRCPPYHSGSFLLSCLIVRGTCGGQDTPNTH